MFIKSFICITVLLVATKLLNAQGCSDAGFCTAGNFNAMHGEAAAKNAISKNEFDILFNYGAHNKRKEEFFQPQINWRHINSKGAFIELRLPLNHAKGNVTNISTTGIGDITATYNSKLSISRKNKIDYSFGFRVSLSNASKADQKNNYSYPMFLQSGLGTTDLIAVANYDIIKYISIGTGLQLPLIQYNKNKQILQPLFMGNLISEGYRRKPDALIKLTGHYQTGKFRINAGLLSIFHLANDNYTSSQGKYAIQDSKGITINWTADCSYAFSNKWMFNILYAEPIVTRKNIPDGLARSRIIVPKMSFSF
jgi:hypothetical protein